EAVTAEPVAEAAVVVAPPVAEVVEHPEPEPEAPAPPPVVEETVAPIAAAEVPPLVEPPTEPTPVPAPVEIAAVEPPPPAPLVEAPPPPAAAFDISHLSESDQKVHKDAKRFARILVSEIELYNKTKVADGRQNRDLYKRLRSDIDRSRQTYEKRFG